MKHDEVNNPSHYEARFATKPMTCICINRYLPGDAAAAFKYVWRSGEKGTRDKWIQDLDKAIFYVRDEQANFLTWNLSETAEAMFNLLVPENSPRYMALKCIVRGEFQRAVLFIEEMKREISEAIKPLDQKENEK